jgi:glycosyltransferase involved in cell wall biosynthesis/predicted DCC family thiol-disulfide oxidoreductase YuxK
MGGPQGAAPDVSVIIATRNRASSLAELLETLAAQQTGGAFTFEVLVMDNGSTDATRETVERLRATFPAPLRYAYEERAGKPWALNAGLQLAQGRLLAFADDDVRAEPGWLAGLWRCAAESGADAVTGRVLPQWIGGRPGWLTDEAFRQIGGMGCIDWGEQRVSVRGRRDCRWVGGNMAIRREAAERLGGFDVRMLRGQDTEYYRRALAQGLHIVYEPSAVVYHQIPAERLTPAYFRQWRDRSGNYQAHLIPWKRSHLLTIMPLWRYGKTLLLLRLWAQAWLRRRPWWQRFSYELMLREDLSTWRRRLQLWPGWWRTAAASWWGRAPGAVRAFFAAEDHALNLAVFRLVVFAALLATIDADYIVRLTLLPAELQVPPRFFGRLLPYLPVAPEPAAAACVAMLACCWTGLLGLFSRTSAALAALLGVYVLGIPQLYGKVNHDHHLLWFAALLSASRCGDAWSLDALIAAWRRADRGLIEPPGPSRAYALPLRFAWLLLGVLYFFPGFWKIWTSGLDWALSDNMKHLLHAKWLQLEGWVPPFRLDRYPALYRLAGAGTLAFELGFIGFIFVPRLRPVVAAAGLLFHAGISLFMRIRFTTLQWCYAILVDWHALLQRLGRRLFRSPVTVLYDGNCALCRRTIALLRSVDVLGRLSYLNALDRTQVARAGFSWLDEQTLLADMYAVEGRRTWAGFDTYRVMALRIPLLWPVAPFLYLWPIPAIGRSIYRWVAESRTCRVAAPRSASPTPASLGISQRPPSWAPGIRPVLIVGVFLLAANIAAGAAQAVAAWPFACYPTFAGMTAPEARALTMVAADASGAVIGAWDGTDSGMSSARRWGLMHKILATPDPAEQRRRLQALWRHWRQERPELQQAASVKFYRLTLLTDPDRRHENPITRELLYDLELATDGR